MRAWFDNLQPRERLTLIGGVIAAALIILWVGVLSPLRTRSELLRDSIASKQRLLVELTRVGPEPARASDTGGSTQTLVVLISSSAREHGIAFKTQRPDGPDGIQVAFASVPFDTLLDWLVAIERQNAITVESASFTSTKQRGIVNGQLVLRRS
jgi:type II secretory pathway component PulM